MKSKKYSVFMLLVLLLSLSVPYERKGVLLMIILILIILAKLPDLLFLAGMYFYSKKKWQVSFTLFQAASTFIYSPNRLKISHAYYLILNGKIEASQCIIDKLIVNQKLNKENLINASLTKSILLWKSGHIDQAIELLSDLKLKYQSTVLYQNLGFYLILNKSYTKALALNIEAHAYDDTNIGIMDNLAQSYYYLGDYLKAQQIYDKLIPLKPEFASVYYYYGLILTEDNQYSKAIEVLEKALDLNFSFISSITKDDIQSTIEKIKSHD